MQQQTYVEEIKELIFYSEGEKQPYRIKIAKPKTIAPKEGYPIIYVLDGNAYFQTFWDAVRIQSICPDITGIEPAIVVGVGYPDKLDFVRERRFHDFTQTPVSSDPLHEKIWPKTGSAKKFLTLLEQIVKPYIYENYQVDCNKQTLFGHSLGGLFALHILFSNTHLFQNYIIGSPSIWWNEKEVLKNESNFLATINDLESVVRVFLFVGSLEKDYMVMDAKHLSERFLTTTSNNLVWQFEELEGENHLSVGSV